MLDARPPLVTHFFARIQLSSAPGLVGEVEQAVPAPARVERSGSSTEHGTSVVDSLDSSRGIKHQVEFLHLQLSSLRFGWSRSGGVTPLLPRLSDNLATGLGLVLSLCHFLKQLVRAMDQLDE